MKVLRKNKAHVAWWMWIAAGEATWFLYVLNGWGR